MPLFMLSLIVLLLLPFRISNGSQLPNSDVDLLEFSLNLEYLEAEFFLFGSAGHGLDKYRAKLTMGGPPPIGARKANLDLLTESIFLQFATQEVGHLRAIEETVKGFPRPLLDLSNKTFANVIHQALGYTLNPPFDPYANGINFLIASYAISYVGLTGYVGAIPKLRSPHAKRLVAGLLGEKSGQDAVLRTLLFERSHQMVQPYNITIAEFSNHISNLNNKLGGAGVKDEGLSITTPMKRSIGNVLAGDQRYSLSFGRSPEEILRIVYGSGNESVPGGFYPNGGGGRIAKSHLKPAKVSGIWGDSGFEG